MQKRIAAIRKHKLTKPKRNLTDKLGAFGVIGGIIFFFLCIIYVISAYWVVGILAEISQKDYTPANQRIAAYEKFFRKAEKNGMEIEKSPPYIKEGAKYFLWTVAIPNQPERLVYRWKHDLQTNKVEPLTSPATYLDIELKYVKPDEASGYPYEPGDPIALQIAQGDYEPPEAYDMPETDLGMPSGPAAPADAGVMPFENVDTSEGEGDEAAPEPGKSDEAPPGGEAKPEEPPKDAGGEAKPGEGEKPKDGGGGEAKPGDGEKPKDDGGGEAKPTDGEGGKGDGSGEDKPPPEDEKPKDDGGKDDSVPVK